MRICKDDVQDMFQRFVRAIGGRVAESNVDVGAYRLERAYGGWRVVRVFNAGGGVSCPFGEGFATSREIYYAMAYAVLAITEAAFVALSK